MAKYLYDYVKFWLTIGALAAFYIFLIALENLWFSIRVTLLGIRLAISMAKLAILLVRLPILMARLAFIIPYRTTVCN